MAPLPVPGRATGGPLPVPGAGRPKLDLAAIAARRRGVATGGASQLSPDEKQQLLDYGRAPSGLTQASKAQSSDDGGSIWDQVGDLVKGVPGGIVNMGKELAVDAVALPRMTVDLARGDLQDHAPSDYVPFTAGVGNSLHRTGYRLFDLGENIGEGHPGDSEYGQAIKHGHIVATLAEDAGNAALIGGAAAKGLTAAGGEAGAREVAARQAALDAGEESARLGARGMATASGQKIAQLMKPIDAAAATPARLWTAPIKALTGAELPARIFGLGEDGLPRKVGLIPALDNAGVIDRIKENPRIAPLIEKVQDFRAGRQQTGEAHDVLLGQTAESHVGAALLDKMTTPARRILDGEGDLEHAMTMTAAGLTPHLEVIRRLRDELPPEAYDDVMNKAFGREAKPTDLAIDQALEYAGGTIDPALAEKINTAWPHVEKALNDVEQLKLTGEGRTRALSEEQLGDVPMPSRIARKVDPLEERAQRLRDDIEGVDTPAGEHVPGLREKAAAARAQVPEVDPGRLIDTKAIGAQRRAGALTREHEMANRAADVATDKAVTAGDRALEAEWGTAGSAAKRLEEMGRRRGGVAMTPEEVLRTGEAERRLPGNAPRIVADDELALAQQVRHLAGTERTGPMFTAQASADRAAGRATAATAESEAAQARIGAAAQADAEGRLQFGDTWTPPSAVDQGRAVRGVREARQAARDQLVARRRAHESRLAVLGPISIPERGTPNYDFFVEMQNELGAASGSERGRFRNMTLTDALDPSRKVNLFTRARGGTAQGIDNLIAAYTEMHGVSEERAWQAILDDVRQAKALKSAEAGVVQHGFTDAQAAEAGISQVDAAMLRAGSPQEAAAAVAKADLEARLGADRIKGRPPWEMPAEEYHAELAQMSDAAERIVNVPVAERTPEQWAIYDRLEELVPEAVRGGTPSVAELHQRLIKVAQAADLPTATPAVVPSIRLTAREDARAVAEEAWRIDRDVISKANAEQRPLGPGELARDQLSAEQRKVYEAMDRRSQSMSAADRAESARQRFGLGQRVAGERAGAQVGRLGERERIFTRESQQQEARAAALEPRAAAADELAATRAEDAVGKPVRLGERRGKRIRDAQSIEKEMRVKARRLEWLQDERIPALKDRLAAGPKEVAPARFVPALATGERLHAAISEMADGIVEATGDAALGDRMRQMLADVPTTMTELQARLRDEGLEDPKYIPGLVDEPVGARGGTGRPDQLPYKGRTVSERQRSYGHVPKKVSTIARSLSREMADIARNKSADLLAEQFARPTSEVLAELVDRGDLPAYVRQGMVDGRYDPALDLGAELDRRGYAPWDPESPSGKVAPTAINAETLLMPKKVIEQYQRWWKPATTNPVLRFYDKATRAFKHSVLAMSPQWNVNNVVGNAFMATVGAGETPLTIAHYAREARRMLAREAEVGEMILPPRLFGAGGSAEVNRYYAEGAEPRTALGRTINKSYALNETVDNIGRSAVFLAKKARGFTEDQAVDAALKAMGDFANLTPFERNVVRRVIPFYAWMRHVTQASMHLAIEHPWRVAWLMHVSDMYNPRDPNTPDWLSSNLDIGGGWTIPLGAFNPYEGTAGSVFTSPKEWVPQTLRSMNPLIKLGSAEVGINLDRAQPFTHAPGVGTTDPYGNSKFGLQNPLDLATYAERMLGPGRLLFDMTHDPVVRYDDGTPVLRRKRPIPLKPVYGGTVGQVAKDLGVPLLPTYVDPALEQTKRLQLEKAAKSAARRRGDG